VKCHICGEPSIGQCRSCWKFYCALHGDVVCERCRDDPAAHQDFPWQAGRLRVRQVGPVEEEADAQQVDFPDMKRGKVLERVVSVAQTRTQGETELTIISVDLYDDGFILNYRLRAPVEPMGLGFGMISLGSTGEILFKVADDRGAKYHGMPGAGSGSGEYWRGDFTFTPRVNPQARELTIRVEEFEWMVRDPRQKSQLQLGPWEFRVPL